MARTNGRALLGELDVAAQDHGLVCPTGVIGHTGVAGLTLGGGVGRLQRRLGLTIDSLRAVEVVIADGRIVRASATEEPDLFWGMRGAGWNFGVVTSIRVRPPSLLRNALSRGPHPPGDRHPGGLADLPRVRGGGTRHNRGENFTVALAGPAGDYAESVAGRPIVVISYNHSGAGEDVERDIAPLLAGPKPASVTATSEPYLTAQKSSDLTLAWGSRTAILGGYVADCSPNVLDAFVAHVEDVPGDASISVTAMGGAIGRVPDGPGGVHRADRAVRCQPRYGLVRPCS